MIGKVFVRTFVPEKIQDSPQSHHQLRYAQVQLSFVLEIERRERAKLIMVDHGQAARMQAIVRGWLARKRHKRLGLHTNNLLYQLAQ